jgi:hypothetical protein
MSHLIEEYAKSCGVEIGKPIIKEHFYPVVHDKYITLHTDAKDQAREYAHWNIVLQLLKQPLSEAGIKIIQIGGEKYEKHPFVDEVLNGSCSFKNTFYVIKKSLLHLGINSLPVHIASVYGKKIVNIFGNLYPECARPYWSKEEDVVNLCPDFSERKPSFSVQEHPKRIDEIKPEDIANSVLKLLNIDHNQKFESLYYGSEYKKRSIQIIPEGNTIKFQDGFNVNLRMDKFYSLEALSKIIQQKKIEITTDKPIPKEFLIKEKIQCINYITDSFDVNFVEAATKKGITMMLLCTDKSKIKEERFKIFDQKIYPYHKKDMIKENKKKIGKVDFDRLKILSTRKILCNGKEYSSFYEMTGKKDDFFLDLDWLMCYYS